MTVHVVAWTSSGRGGFEWFYAKENAEAAYRGEILNVMDLADDNWTAYRFDVETDKADPEVITDEIGSRLTELCTEAPVKGGLCHDAIGLRTLQGARECPGAIIREDEFTSYVAALSYFLQQAEAFALEGTTVYFKEKEGRKWITKFTTVI